MCASFVSLDVHQIDQLTDLVSLVVGCETCVEVTKSHAPRKFGILLSDVQQIAGAYEKEDWLPQSAEALTSNLFQYVDR